LYAAQILGQYERTKTDRQDINHNWLYKSAQYNIGRLQYVNSAACATSEERIVQIRARIALPVSALENKMENRNDFGSMCLKNVRLTNYGSV
jgi:hypothetical protein